MKNPRRVVDCCCLCVCCCCCCCLTPPSSASEQRLSAGSLLLSLSPSRARGVNTCLHSPVTDNGRILLTSNISHYLCSKLPRIKQSVDTYTICELCVIIPVHCRMMLIYKTRPWSSVSSVSAGVRSNQESPAVLPIPVLKSRDLANCVPSP